MDHVGRAHELALASRKKRMASSTSESMPWNIWPIIEGKLTGVKAVASSTPAMMAKATDTPL